MEQDAKPAPERRPEPTRREDVRVTALSRCPFCHADAGVAASRGVCANCLARHHDACWSESGRCAACAHQVRLELPQPETRPATRPLVLLLVLAAICLAYLWSGQVGNEEREAVANRLRMNAEARLVLERSSAAATAEREREELEVTSRSSLRDAEARAERAAGVAQEAEARASALLERLDATQAQLRAAEVRAYAADARAERLEARLNVLGAAAGASRAPARPAVWDRGAARAAALAALAHAAAGPVDDAERPRLSGARASLQREPPGPPVSLLAGQSALIMFPSPEHPAFTARTTRALAEFGPARSPLFRAYAGHVRLALGELAAGRADAEAALDLDPSCALAWLVRAQARLAAGDLDGAMGDVLVGEALDDGRSGWSVYPRALIHAARREHGDAVVHLELLRSLAVTAALGLEDVLEAHLKEQRDLALVPRPR